MACRYYYRNHEFNSEIELDNFLLTKLKYFDKYGDLVFLADEQQFKEREKLEKLKELNKELWDKYLDLRRRGLIMKDEDGDEYILDGNEAFRWTGVNKFLSTHHQSENPNKWLFPYVDMDNYFYGDNGRTKDWANGIYNDVEKEIFFNNDPSKINTKMNPSEFKYYEELLRTKWDFQARMGDAIHAVLQTYFSTDDLNNKNYELDDNALFTVVKNMLENTPAYSSINGHKVKTTLALYFEYNGNIDTNIKECITFAKLLHENLKSKYGENLVFYPEYLIEGHATNDSNKTYKLFGKIDLLVLDEKGNYHILDYKTSIKDYSKFDPAKRGAYSYLLVTYYQMLENAGLNVDGADLVIVPIQIDNFTKESNDKYHYHGLKFSRFEPLNGIPLTEKAMIEAESFIPSKYTNQITAKDTYQNSALLLNKWFGDITISKILTEETVKKMLDRYKVFEKKDDDGKYVFHMRTVTGKIKILKTETLEEMISKVLTEEKQKGSGRHRSYNNILNALKEGIELQTSDVEWPAAIGANYSGSSTYLRDTLSKYCNGEWEVLDLPAFADMETIVLLNKETRLLDFVGVSTNDLYLQVLKEKDHTSLLGKFETNALAELKYRRLSLQGIMGNIELMQIMLAINSLNKMEKYTVGEVSVINQFTALRISASNEQLLMNFNALCRHHNVEVNKFDTGEVKLASYYDLVRLKLDELWHLGKVTDWEDKELLSFKINLNNAKSEFDAAKDGTLQERITATLKLLVDLRTKITQGASLSEEQVGLDRLELRKVNLYNLTLFTLAELNNVHFRQLTQDGYKYYSTISKTAREGQHANYIDNPGNLDSETLNLITSLVKQAYQNTREDMQREKIKFTKILDKLKLDLGFSYLKENIGFNLADLYAPLYEELEIDGVKDLFFKKVEDVDIKYRPLLQYTLETINRNRLANRNPQEIAKMIEDYDPEYYRVPLAKGSRDSRISAIRNTKEENVNKTLLGYLGSRLSYLNPKNWAKMYQLMIDNLQRLGYAEDESKRLKESNLIFEMENFFDRGESNRAKALEQLGGRNNIERNVETLLMKHVFAYSLKKHVDTVFPLIQAASAHLNIQGANAGTTFTADKEYFKDYITSKVKKESIISPELLSVSRFMGMLKMAASKMTLAFTPVQMLYQPLQGLWQDISLAIRKPDGREAFTFNHFKNSLKLVYGDLIDFSGKPTLCSTINEFYALNDMDMNKYVDAITKNKKGFLYNFDGMCYKFASRPDYYNRLAIFVSLMLGDGCLEAHSVKDGRLHYDWKLDKRFSKFAADPKNKNNTDPEYIKQRSLYYAMAKLMVIEGARNEDGSLFELNMEDPQPLPKAYTVKLAEGYKSVADDIYGYYTEENKSLIQATALGSMWLLFKTYWSGKKNQYLQSGGIRQRGHWENYTEIAKDENGQNIIDQNTGKPKVIEYYYDIKEDGSVNYNKIVSKEELSPDKWLAPVTYWKGEWQEGIMVTMMKLCKDHHIIRNYHLMMEEDPDMARCYMSNIKQLGYDLTMFVVGGLILGGILSDWLKELLKENKDNKDFLVGCELAAAKILVNTVRNSFVDFNALNSIGEPLTLWTPFAISFTALTIKNGVKAATGELDIPDALVNSFGATRLLKPIFDALKPEMFRTKQEGGTWESSTAKSNREKREENL